MLNRGRIISRRASYREEISPMESMVNLVDVMLVFICGLLMSIFAYWNISMDGLVAVADQDQLVQIDNPEEITAQMQTVSSYDSVGSAVLDPKTGNLYVMDGSNGSSAEPQ